MLFPKYIDNGNKVLTIVEQKMIEITRAFF